MHEEPKLVVSSLSQKISSGGETVSIEIYRLKGDTSWALEVVDEYNNSTVWNDTFKTESAALTEVKKTILAEGVGSENDENNGKWH